MIKLKVYNSSSHGNTFLFKTSKTNLLIDCGYYCKELQEDIKIVDAILLTHSHTHDHLKAIPKIKDYYKHNYYGCKEVIDILPIIDTYKKELIEDEILEINNLKIVNFKVYHDVDCRGFLIKDIDSNTKTVFMSDLGNITDFEFKDIDYYIIEVNHNLDTIDMEEYKNARSIQYHTNIQDATQFLLNNINYNTKKIILIHISRSQEDYQSFADYIKEKLNNDKIEVIAINPNLKEPLEITLKEDLKGFNFDD